MSHEVERRNSKWHSYIQGEKLYKCGLEYDKGTQWEWHRWGIDKVLHGCRGRLYLPGEQWKHIPVSWEEGEHFVTIRTLDWILRWEAFKGFGSEVCHELLFLCFMEPSRANSVAGLSLRDVGSWSGPLLSAHCHLRPQCCVYVVLGPPSVIKSKLCKDKDVAFRYPQSLESCLAHSTCLINIYLLPIVKDEMETLHILLTIYPLSKPSLFWFLSPFYRWRNSVSGRLSNWSKELATSQCMNTCVWR